MSSKMKKPADPETQARLRAELRRDLDSREKSYRERALKLFAHVCTRCGRQFSGSRLRELTVHHRNHDHENNPPDGSNWELLCLYCHDNEHEKFRLQGMASSPDLDSTKQPSPIVSPFESLDKLIKPQS